MKAAPSAAGSAEILSTRVQNDPILRAVRLHPPQRRPVWRATKPIQAPGRRARKKWRRRAYIAAGKQRKQERRRKPKLKACDRGPPPPFRNFRERRRAAAERSWTAPAFYYSLRFVPFPPASTHPRFFYFFVPRTKDDGLLKGPISASQLCTASYGGQTRPKFFPLLCP